MVGVVPLQLVLLGLVAVERAIELARSTSHARALLARGGIEHGARHYPAMVASHVAFYALWTGETAWRRPPADAWLAAFLALFAAAQAARLWTLASLGGRWTTRVVTLPGAPLVRRGPYRWLDHPNYAIVVVELASLAVAFRCWIALAFALASQAAVLRVRLAVEARALDHAAGAGHGPPGTHPS